MLTTIVYAIRLLFKLLEYAIFADIILSWIMPNLKNRAVQILHIFTEPFLAPGRKLQKKFYPESMLDFSPIIALMILWFLQSVILTIL